MALLDIFKKKKKIKEKKEEKKEKKEKKELKKPSPEKEIKEKEVKEKKIEKKEEVKKEKLKKEKTKKEKTKKEKSIIAGGKLAYRILKSAHITEKTTDLARENKYTFRVYPDANKTEIKKAVEQLYKVDVLDVKIIKVPRKRRRLGMTRGWRREYKKAIVKIKEGQKIEEFVI